MNIKDSMRLMEVSMKARVPYLLVGHSGIGKSQITEQISKKVFPEHKFVPIFASQCDVGDFIGIPDIITKGKDRITTWARPEWMPSEPCVIFLDELNNARPDVESAMLQLVLEKRIHTHSLHPDSYICAAVNPASSEYTTANNLSTALVKRFMVLAFEPMATEFLDWARDSKRVHPKLLAFLKHQPMITGAEKKLDTLIKLEPCPRLWEMVSKIYTVIEAEGNQDDRDLVKDLLISSVGVNAAGTFLSWLDTQDKPLTFKDIIEDPEAALVKYNGFYTDMRNDLIGGTNENIVNGIKDIHEKLVGKIAYKTSILEVDRKADQTQVTNAIKEFNVNIKGNMGVYKKKLDNLISFLKEVPMDVMFQISHSLITAKPHIDKQANEDEKAYHTEQLKRFEAYNTIMFYMYRDDLRDDGAVALNKKFKQCTAEVNKHKKTEQKANQG